MVSSESKTPSQISPRLTNSLFSSILSFSSSSGRAVLISPLETVAIIEEILEREKGRTTLETTCSPMFSHSSGALALSRRKRIEPSTVILTPSLVAVWIGSSPRLSLFVRSKPLWSEYSRTWALKSLATCQKGILR